MSSIDSTTHKFQNPNSLPAKATLLLVSTLTVMAGATISPALPAMRQYFANEPNADYWVRLVLTVPALFIALGAPFAGTIIDKFGRKTLLSIAVFIYGLAGSSGFVLNSLGIILLGRVLLGLSVAGIMTTATTLIADYYTGVTRTLFLGLQAGFMGLGGVIFLSLGGFLADLNWRMPFLIYLIAWLILPLIVIFLPEPNRATSNTSNSQAIQNEPSSFPWRLLILTYGIALFTQMVFYLIPVQLPFYLQKLVNASASQSGMAIALATLFSSISAIIYQRIKARLSFISIYTLAFILMGIGYQIISLAQNYGVVLFGLAIAGAGLGLLTPNMNVCLTSVVSSMSRGKVLGGLTTAFFLGQFTSPIISQPLSQAIGLSGTYGYAAKLVFIFAFIAFVVMLRWK